MERKKILVVSLLSVVFILLVYFGVESAQFGGFFKKEVSFGNAAQDTGTDSSNERQDAEDITSGGSSGGAQQQETAAEATGSPTAASDSAPVQNAEIESSGTPIKVASVTVNSGSTVRHNIRT